jgi:hypothetical protein
LKREERDLKAPRAIRKENKVMGPVRLGTKIRCTGEVQQQFRSQSVEVRKVCSLPAAPPQGVARQQQTAAAAATAALSYTGPVPWGTTNSKYQINPFRL